MTVMVATTMIVATNREIHTSVDIGNKNENHDDSDPLKTQNFGNFYLKLILTLELLIQKKNP